MLLATLNTPDKFQHTAARRRLLSADRINGENHAVSTHSRAEAAARHIRHKKGTRWVSTHSRAEAAAFIFHSK